MGIVSHTTDFHFTNKLIHERSSDFYLKFYFQAKLAFERLPVPKVFHPFVCGPNNSNIKQLMEETGAKINVPPPSVMKDEIVVSGEKEGVMKCKTTIMQICEEKVGISSHCSTLLCQTLQGKRKPDNNYDEFRIG